MSNEKELIQEIELLKTALQIERTKVYSLKKMLKAEYELKDSKKLNLHDLLGLKSHEDISSLKREFKKLLKALHPDKGGDERLFKVFSDHYSTLKYRDKDFS
ncbi:DnaJ domain-containing protein [Peribacillus kribbensis]|uniref:DnaJ domain-containing protein n=1 Tax=Peribacillus kribbensis TaxID=356658 RepID=UPI0012DFB457|nr:DnaJ domain-containing protein [Peribacillus kribbensis]